MYAVDGEKSYIAQAKVPMEMITAHYLSNDSTIRR